MKIYLLWVVALYAIIIPLLALGVLRSLGRISDYRIDDRRERLLPLLVGAVCYVLCAITIAKIPSAIFLRKFMIAAACCEVMCLAVSLYWKISLHLTAMGAVVALLVVMNIAGVGDMMVPLMIAILCAGMRLIRSPHTKKPGAMLRAFLFQIRTDYRNSTASAATANPPQNPASTCCPL